VPDDETGSTHPGSIAASALGIPVAPPGRRLSGPRYFDRT
jgi:hypothetical protein